MVDNIQPSNNINVSNNTIRPGQEPRPITPPPNVPDPTRVTGPSKNDPESQAKDSTFSYNPDSVMQKLFEALRSSPSLTENMKNILAGKYYVDSAVRKDPAFRALLDSFALGIKLDPKQIQELLKFQYNHRSKFSGQFFDSLRTIITENPSDEKLKDIVGQFLKSYDGFVSADKTIKSACTILDNIKGDIPDVLKDTVESLKNRLVTTNPSKASDINLAVLKNDVLPFLAQYVSKTNDYGIIRTYISVLIGNIVRMENGSTTQFLESCDKLFNYLKHSLFMDDKMLESLKDSMFKSVFENSSVKSETLDSFFELLSAGIKSSENTPVRAAFENMTQALLVNHNANLPLIHLFLPLNFNGNTMFSELWVGREKEREDARSSYRGNGYTQKIFITFDIANVGSFENIITINDSNVVMDITVPESLKKYDIKISSEITELLKNHSLPPATVRISEYREKRKLTDIFNNLTERSTGINVII